MVALKSCSQELYPELTFVNIQKQSVWGYLEPLTSNSITEDFLEAPGAKGNISSLYPIINLKYRQDELENQY